MLSRDQLSRLDRIKESYADGVPLSYLLEKEEFWGLEFLMSPAVLIPRPETELIVEEAIRIIKEKRFCDILDLCCGSGNIAVSIEKTLGIQIRMYASDISFEALRVAAGNRDRHHCTVRLVQSDLFSAFKPDSFDLVISNPPYVASCDISPALAEPYRAFAGGDDGMDYLLKIIDQAVHYLRRGGYLVMEMGSTHRGRLSPYIFAHDSYRIEGWIKDYAGHWRGVVLQKRQR